jgi:uncharacterized protein (DUF1778 family)
MDLNVKAEAKRGFEEASKQFVALRGKWPKAFPSEPHEVRPLAPGTIAIVAKELGWSTPYARAVLDVWKRRDAYCRAVLTFSLRIALDGSQTNFTVEDKARSDARKVIEQRQAKRKREAEKAALRAQSLRVSASDQHEIAKALLDPPKPNEALKRGASQNLFQNVR